jgi:pimeloyl-ACP methyl ester carboxylesterase
MIAAMRLRRAAVLALTLATSACVGIREPETPMATRVLVGGPGSPGRCLILLLPGRRDSFGVYAHRKFPEKARAAGVDADFVEVDAHLGYYRAETITKRLEADVVAPARQRGVEKIWIAGISMGGLGGILLAREHPDLSGVIALSPYLGEQEPKLVAAAGGLASYEMGAPRPVADYERTLWGWLKRYAAAGAERPPVWLGIASEDDLAPAERLLADALPPGRAFVVKGGHDWTAWTKLWDDVLAAGVLQKECGASAGR